MPNIGDERYLLEFISSDNVLALARRNGWTEDLEGVREFCEPEDAAVYRAFKNLSAAEACARKLLKGGTAFYGCILIDRQIYRKPEIDGKLIGVPAEWETEHTYEVAMDGETIEVER